MPFDLESIKAEFDETIGDSKSYLSKGLPFLAKWLNQDPRRWVLLGPWWGFVQQQIGNTIDTSQWAGGDTPPEEINHYTNFEPAHLGLFLALKNINRHGGTVLMTDEPQSIVLADGRNALYHPEDGIIETD